MVCAFSVLQYSCAGIISLVIADDNQTELQHSSSANDDEDAPERSEREVTFQEYFFTHLYINVTPLCITCSPAGYADAQSDHHLGWVAPVPTPPPNQVV